MAGCDAVISAVGPTNEKDVSSRSTANVIEAAPPRYVVVSGAGIDVEGDRKDLLGKLVSFLVRVSAPDVYHDKVREYQLLGDSDIAWTLVRPPRLLNKPAKGAVRTDLQNSPGPSLTREDLATYLLQVVRDESLVGKAPFVAN
jgi:hypothetical protein